MLAEHGLQWSTRSRISAGRGGGDSSSAHDRVCWGSVMLGAQKFSLLAGLKVEGLQLTKAELDFYIARYYAAAGLSSLLVGMAYVGLIKIKVPEHMEESIEEYYHAYWNHAESGEDSLLLHLNGRTQPHDVFHGEILEVAEGHAHSHPYANGEAKAHSRTQPLAEEDDGRELVQQGPSSPHTDAHVDHHGESQQHEGGHEHGDGHEHGGGHEHEAWPWQVSAFFISVSSTMALSLLNLSLTSFLVVGAQGMILRGPPGSLQKCVSILSAYWLPVCALMVASFGGLLASIMSIQWMKLEDAPWNPASALFCTAIFMGVMLTTLSQIYRMMNAFSIPDKDLVGTGMVVHARTARGKSATLDLSGERELM